MPFLRAVILTSGMTNGPHTLDQIFFFLLENKFFFKKPELYRYIAKERLFKCFPKLKMIFFLEKLKFSSLKFKLGIELLKIIKTAN